MYDLILKGATVLDPSTNRNGLFDVAVERGSSIFTPMPLPGSVGAI